MASIEDDPIRLEAPAPYSRRQLCFRSETHLPSPIEVRGSVIAALVQWRSAEVFTPISTDQLATWLPLHGLGSCGQCRDPNRQRRYVASFGALHPAHIVLGARRVLGMPMRLKDTFLATFR